MTEKYIKSIRSELQTNKYCYGQFQYYYGINDGNVSVAKLSRKKMTERFQ